MFGTKQSTKQDYDQLGGRDGIMLTHIRTLEENNRDFPDGPVAKNG